jgi:hypothetical protein
VLDEDRVTLQRKGGSGWWVHDSNAAVTAALLLSGCVQNARGLRSKQLHTTTPRGGYAWGKLNSK